MGYIYLIKEREFVRLKEDVYKIGRSSQLNCKRINKYPKGSKLICILEFEENINFIELKLINIFKQRFKFRKDYGNEYFEGDKHLMIREIFECKYQQTSNDKDLLYNFYELEYINDINSYVDDNVMITHINYIANKKGLSIHEIEYHIKRIKEYCDYNPKNKDQEWRKIRINNSNTILDIKLDYEMMGFVFTDCYEDFIEFLTLKSYIVKKFKKFRSYSCIKYELQNLCIYDKYKNGWRNIKIERNIFLE